MVVLLTLNFVGIKILNLHDGSDAQQKALRNTIIFNAFVFCQARYDVIEAVSTGVFTYSELGGVVVSMWVDVVSLRRGFHALKYLTVETWLCFTFGDEFLFLFQIFNEINSRRLNSFNIFQGLHKSFLFMGVILITIILQVGLLHSSC